MVGNLNIGGQHLICFSPQIGYFVGVPHKQVFIIAQVFVFLLPIHVGGREWKIILSILLTLYLDAHPEPLRWGVKGHRGVEHLQVSPCDDVRTPYLQHPEDVIFIVY